MKYGRKDILIGRVNHEFITEYEFYLQSVQKLQHNSAMGIMKKLKKIIAIETDKWEAIYNFLKGGDRKVLHTRKTKETDRQETCIGDRHRPSSASPIRIGGDPSNTSRACSHHSVG